MIFDQLDHVNEFTKLEGRALIAWWYAILWGDSRLAARAWGVKTYVEHFSAGCEHRDENRTAAQQAVIADCQRRVAAITVEVADAIRPELRTRMEGDFSALGSTCDQMTAELKRMLRFDDD